MRWLAIVLSAAGCSASGVYRVPAGALPFQPAAADGAPRRWSAIPAERTDGEQVYIRSDVIVSAVPTADPSVLRVKTLALLPAAIAGTAALLGGILTAVVGGALVQSDRGAPPCGAVLCYGPVAQTGFALFGFGVANALVGAVVALVAQGGRPAEVPGPAP